MGIVSSYGAVSGIPEIDYAICSNCKACLNVCSAGVLIDGVNGEISATTDGAGGAFGCIACGQCMMVCPKGAIKVRGRGLSPSDIFELPAKDLEASADQLEALMIGRRSIRSFTDEEVSREDIGRIVGMASMAPMGIPPWEVGVKVFHGRDKVRELSGDVTEAYKSFLKIFGNPLILKILRPFFKRSLYEQFQSFILPLARIIVDGREKGEDYMLYDAPAALLFHTSPYADQADAAIACTYAMLAAESLGLGSCMIGCLAPAMAQKKKLLKKYGIPRGHKPAIVLILGYPKVRFLKGVRRKFLSVKDF